MTHSMSTPGTTTAAAALARRARARGFDVVFVHEDGDEVHIGGVEAGGGEVVMIPHDDGTDCVALVGVISSWSYQSGPDYTEFDLGSFAAECDAFGYLRHLAGCAERAIAEQQAAQDAYEAAEAKIGARMTLAEMLTKFEADGFTPDAPIAEDADYAYVTNEWGSGFGLSPTNYGVTLVIGQMHWGKGDTLAEAKTQWRKQGGRLSRGYVVYEFPAETLFLGVNGMGGVHWLGEAPTEREVAPRIAQPH